MKFVPSYARALLAGVALIVVTNAVVLAGVAYNRSGQPESVLKLTERELRIHDLSWSWPSTENSSIDAHLTWRVAQVPGWDEEVGYRSWYLGLSWLKPAQLRELGFEIPADLESEEGMERVAKQPSRRAWVVLENDGPAYQAALEYARKSLERATALASANADDPEFQQRLNTARGVLEREERMETRLYVVDAGPDETALRARYPDRQRYAIVNGRLNAMIEGDVGRRHMTALVAEIDADSIRVPHQYRSIVEPLARPQEYFREREPRFAATVNFGRRFEPWIVDLALLE